MSAGENKQKAQPAQCDRQARRPTPKQEQFAHLYIQTGNASEAYRQAFNAAGMSVASVNKEAKRLLVHPRITPLLDELREGLVQAHAITADHVIAELAAIAFADIRKAVRWGNHDTAGPAEDGRRSANRSYVIVVNSTEIDDDIAAAIAEVSKNRYGIKIRLYDKLAALDKLAKMLGLYEDENDTKNANVVVEIHPLEVQPRPPEKQGNAE